MIEEVLAEISDFLWIPAFVLLVGFGCFALVKLLAGKKQK